MGIILLPLILFFGFILPKIIISIYVKNHKTTVNFFPILLIGYGFLLFLTSLLISSAPIGVNYIAVCLQYSLFGAILYIGYRWADFKDNGNKLG